MIFSFTGHRPKKLGGYDNELTVNLFAENILKDHMIRGRDAAIVGMALGWDTAVALNCETMHIPYIAAIPFRGQEKMWPLTSQERYKRLLSNALEVVVVDPQPLNFYWSMQLRNMWMVDHSDVLISLWDGSDGGTANCNRYASKIRREVVQVWDQWLRFQN